MRQRKTLQELTIKNNFMFGAVMSDEENCRLLLERVLDMPIERVHVSKEKSLIYHPEYKGVRLDVFAREISGRSFNVEIQILREPSPGRRSRYYHSQIDMDLLLKGTDYEELPDKYVIFICDYDPFGRKKYRYIFRNMCLENKNVDLKDGNYTIFLNTHGENDDAITDELRSFLKYVKADLKESSSDFQDDYVRKLQAAVVDIKQKREMEERYMLFEELLKREFKEGKAVGKAESILDFLEELEPVSEELKNSILEQTDLTVLARWLKLAARSETIADFTANM